MPDRQAQYVPPSTQFIGRLGRRVGKIANERFLANSQNYPVLDVAAQAFLNVDVPPKGV